MFRKKKIYKNYNIKRAKNSYIEIKRCKIHNKKKEKI